MRRTDKEIINPEKIEQIIRSCTVCRLGMAMDNVPYIIPLSFGYDGEAFYIHTALAGRKIEFFESNPNVCLEFEHAVTLKPNESAACNWTFSFQSVIGSGIISEVNEPSAKSSALDLIMKQYSQQEWNFSDARVDAVRVWKISIASLSGKQSKDMMTSE
jgi:nitroimidazol reductase NimA-like FMN-containing flavoprotein (pyridoxamine 5'-phosphate oxidase superfamily)